MHDLSNPAPHTLPPRMGLSRAERVSASVFQGVAAIRDESERALVASEITRRTEMIRLDAMLGLRRSGTAQP